MMSDFKPYHLKPIAPLKPLQLECKVAPLSVFSWRRTSLESNNKRSGAISISRLAIGDRDTCVLDKIFSFAASPTLRKVYFCEEYGLVRTI